MYVVKCKKCGRKYGYRLSGQVVPGGKERETAFCPYCGEEGPSEVTSLILTVYKLDEKTDGKDKK